ncbi:DUF58 domain-containing protein [Thermus oshimai]|jgi:uncharacterized protein (DUF58 family)|uniref:DUF58 domain-containing protein n=1 Tax=Thermus oshimai JL-2 TaxID=751945 RepID=K7QWU9_THEOS|nr:DUF58 domain-containing protein [Thermus oshimai]AFV76118.1 hypothetical protein Theos_1068 [Thermus oshimai JL-2]
METPEALLRRLELKVVRPLDGLLFGDYRGVFYGRSLELAEISPYHPGDELERIDWPATARTGTLHVRRFREEKELTLWLLLDGGPTVRFGSRRREKYALGLELALAFAYIALRHGNRVGGVVSGRLLPPKGGRAQALALAEAALKAAEDPAPLGERLDLLGRVARRRGLLFVFSDFLDEFALPLGRLAARHDLVAVLLEDPLERELPEGVWRFRDPRTGEVVEVDALDPRVRAAYRARAEALRKARLEALRRAGAEVVLASTEMDLVPLILGFVERRRRWPSRSRGPSFSA